MATAIAADLIGTRAGSTRAADVVEVDLNKATDHCLGQSLADCLLRSSVECLVRSSVECVVCRSAERIDQAQPIDRMNQAGVLDHRGALVRLQSADEMPSQRSRSRIHRRDGANLGCGFLIAVLSHVRDTEFSKQNDV